MFINTEASFFSSSLHDTYFISAMLFLIWAALSCSILFFASRRISNKTLQKPEGMYIFSGALLIFTGLIFIDLITDQLSMYIDSVQAESQKFLTDNEITFTPANLEVYRMLVNNIIDTNAKFQNYYERIILLVSGGVGGGLITQGFIEKNKSNNSKTPNKIKKLKRNNFKPRRRN